MHPSQCSVVLVDNCATDEDELVATLKSIYHDVLIVENGYDALATLQRRQQKSRLLPTLLLIDVENANRNINVASRSSECIQLLKTVVRQLADGSLRNTIPIVCSCSDSPEFMLDCLASGAADYIVKPLQEDVIKTLFLNVARYRHQKDPQSMIKSEGNDCEKRIKALVEEDWLQEAIFQHYAPEPSIRRSSMSSMTSDRIAYLRSKICSWDFLPLDLDEKDLVQCVCMMINQVLEIPDLAEFRVPINALYNFVFDISNSYHNNNPYHNFRHAVDVMQSNYYFLCKMGVLSPMDKNTYAVFSKTRGGVGFSSSSSSPPPRVVVRLRDLLRPLDVFALMMASIGHDLCHPGVTNMFLVNSCTPLAMLYNDRSVLESYHSMAFFHLLRRHCFRKLTEVRKNPQFAGFRKIIVHSILATDMSMHDDYVRQIREQAERLRHNEIDMSNECVREQERLLLCGALIKCADIGNCARPFPIAKRWAEVLAEEFARQGDLEKEMDLTVIPINQRGKVPLEDFQLTFATNVAMKLFEAVTAAVPEMEFCVGFNKENIGLWKNMKHQPNLDSGVAVKVPKKESQASDTHPESSAKQHVAKSSSSFDDGSTARSAQGPYTLLSSPNTPSSSKSSSPPPSSRFRNFLTRRPSYCQCSMQ